MLDSGIGFKYEGSKFEEDGVDGRLDVEVDKRLSSPRLSG